MSAINEIIELIKTPYRDRKVFTPAQNIFLSAVIFFGIIALYLYNKGPITTSLLTAALVGAIITCLFIAVYSSFNKRKSK